MTTSGSSRGRNSGAHAADYARNVFLNCPFDEAYQPLFDAVTFTVFVCGCVARCAKEIDDSGEVRIDKIVRIIGECRLGIHDLSRTEVDPQSHLPRFNMPLELGLFLGAKRFGAGPQRTKNCLVLDVAQYRYQAFISDIAGQDIRAHAGQIGRIVTIVRDWLANAFRGRALPGGIEIKRRFDRFSGDLPILCAKLQLDPKELTFNDYANLVSVWMNSDAPALP